MTLCLPSTTFDSKPRRSLRSTVVFVASILAALGVNVAALAIGASMPGPGASVQTRDAPSPVRPLFVVPAREPAAAPAAPPSTQRTEVHEPIAAAPPPARHEDVPLAWAKAPEANPQAPQPVRFYRLREVDSPAQPTEDWNLDIDALDKLGLSRLAFEVLIDERGEIVGCTVLDPPALADDLRNALEERLRHTRMSPATRAGSNVPSVRRIELFVSEQQP
jgi:hypothetical protein